MISFAFARIDECRCGIEGFSGQGVYKVCRGIEKQTKSEEVKRQYVCTVVCREDA